MSLATPRSMSPLLAVGLFSCTALYGCTIENKPSATDASGTDTASACSTLVANAGPDQTVTLGTTLTVDGSASTVCPTADRTFTWTFEAVPTDSAVTEDALSENGTSTAEAVAFTPDVPGDYVLSLVVSDGASNSAPDLVVLTVTAEDDPPIADCGGNLAGTQGVRSSMDGSRSYDPEGAELSYAWTLSSAPDCSDLASRDIYDSDTVTSSMVPDCEGIFIVSLVVSDGFQWSEPDLCYIEVATDNRLPVADAGDSEDLPPCIEATIDLDGYGSYDLDGESLTYQWSLVSAPAGSTASDANFSDITAAGPTFTLPDDPVVAGNYIFQLQVFDGNDWSAPDIVTYTVLSEASNTPPIANAGDDQTIEADADCTVGVSYSATCEDCPAAEVDLDGSASYDPDGDGIRYSWSEATGSVGFELPHSSETTATLPAVPAEYRVDTTVNFEVNLEVDDDCGATGDDTMTISYVCTGTKSTSSF